VKVDNVGEDRCRHLASIRGNATGLGVKQQRSAQISQNWAYF